MRTRIRKTMAMAAIAVGVIGFAAPAFAQEEEPDFANHAAEECFEKLENGATVDDCQKAPSPLRPEWNEIIWGSAAFLVLLLAAWKWGVPAVKNMEAAREERIRNDLERAETALRAALAADSKYVDAHHSLGAVLAARHQWAPAIGALRRAIELRPDLTSALYTLARVLRQSGDEGAARRELQEADRLRTRGQLEQEASVWTATGTQKLETGDAAGAQAHFERAIAIFGAYAPAHYQLGRALQKLGRLDAARAAFHRAQQLNSSLLPPPIPK